MRQGDVITQKLKTDALEDVFKTLDWNGHMSHLRCADYIVNMAECLPELNWMLNKAKSAMSAAAFPDSQHTEHSDSDAPQSNADSLNSLLQNRDEDSREDKCVDVECLENQCSLNCEDGGAGSQRRAVCCSPSLERQASVTGVEAATSGVKSQRATTARTSELHRGYYE
ncbi:unnamed protein product [Plutella xylostella]|uniref:(diamondback moth) hypothetical protein n=1 Tax=Plutella xylostella TaxID=51655 RepID=A0A8S4FTL8_PLUXY|nr:unnamed protein product [Plutella xylostella]